MIDCLLDFDQISADRKKVYLQCPGIGKFEVFSGDMPFTNRPECSFIDHSAIPNGKYWIVDRPRGPWKSRTLTWAEDFATGNEHSTWFALYRADGSIDDQTFISGVRRSHFRIHPLRPDGSGTSWGCITFFRSSEFMFFRNSLLRVQKFRINNTNLLSYGSVTVKGSVEGPCYVR